MYLIKRIHVGRSNSKLKVDVENGLRVLKLPKKKQKSEYELIGDKWDNVQISVKSDVYGTLDEDSNGYKVLDSVNEAIVTYNEKEEKYYTDMELNKREDTVEGYIVTVDGIMPGNIVKLTGKKLAGLYPEHALCQLKEGESFEFCGLLKIWVENHKLVIQ